MSDFSQRERELFRMAKELNFVAFAMKSTLDNLYHSVETNFTQDQFDELNVLYEQWIKIMKTSEKLRKFKIIEPPNLKAGRRHSTFLNKESRQLKRIKTENLIEPNSASSCKTDLEPILEDTYSETSPKFRTTNNALEEAIKEAKISLKVNKQKANYSDVNTPTFKTETISPKAEGKVENVITITDGETEEAKVSDKGSCSSSEEVYILPKCKHEFTTEVLQNYIMKKGE